MTLQPLPSRAYLFSRLDQASKEERLARAAKWFREQFWARYEKKKAQLGLREGRPAQRLLRYEARPIETWAWFAQARLKLFREQSSDYGSLLTAEGERGLLTVQRIEQYEAVRRLERTA